MRQPTISVIIMGQHKTKCVCLELYAKQLNSIEWEICRLGENA